MSEKYTYRGSTVYEQGEELSTIDIVDLLNKQQSIIEELKTHNLQHFLEWLVIKGYVTDEQMKDINNVIACVNEFNEYIREFEKELLDNGR